MTGLADILLRDGVRQKLVDEVSHLVEEEVSERRDVVGLAIRGGYKLVTSLRRDFVRDAVEDLVEPFITELDPLFSEYGKLEGFEEYLIANRARVAEGMLRVTNSRRDAATNSSLKRTYDSLIPIARRSVERAVPRIGHLIQRCFDDLDGNGRSTQPA